ncbi:uncharacterized protein DEA37_0013378 [Paragonimus westermani]|uniref:Integrase catalytic domain-containing protein n=1 Tax=Paragonimus westermani TaxID=34504 RepID=A0A5J4N431_9TREM|nr:uncharacterized protein DEA37_0003905 [Paragonimus westermani]KAA3673884.1 uncharacterized protein DEA37_0013378 [Paragonimus westermani]
MDGWILNYGVPTTITINRGTNFHLALFRDFSLLLGVGHNTTIAYHSAAKRLIKRYCRRLETALEPQLDPQRPYDHLFLVTLRILSTVKKDIRCTFSFFTVFYGLTTCKSCKNQ